MEINFLKQENITYWLFNQKVKRRDEDLNLEAIAGPVFESHQTPIKRAFSGALPGYAIAAPKNNGK